MTLFISVDILSASKRKTWVNTTGINYAEQDNFEF